MIGSFVYTDVLGRAISTLATLGDPVELAEGPGFFKVTASTVTENSETIYTSTTRLLSYQPIISNVSPSTFAIKNGGSVAINFTVKDFHGNPISSDHTISFGVEGSLSVSPGSIKVPDALYGGTSITEFTFTVGDSDSNEISPGTAAVSINVTGPFGTFTYSIVGTTE